MFPPVRPRRRMKVGAAGMRGAGRRKEKVCLNQHNFFFFFLFEGDVRNWDSGGIADVPGLCMPQTQDTHTRTDSHKAIFFWGGGQGTRLHAKGFSCPWGQPPHPSTTPPPRFQKCFQNDAAPNLHALEFDFLHKKEVFA